MKRALVVGGQHSFVKSKLSKSLARHGIEIAQHWAWDRAKPPAVWPKNLDLIYICTDMVSHKVATPAVEYCRSTGIPYVNGTRKWAESIVRLTGAGFPLVDPSDSLAEILDEHLKGLTPTQRLTGPTEIETEAMLVALAGSIDLAEDLTSRAANLLNSSPETPLPERVMPPSITATIAVPAPASPLVVKHRDPYAYARDPHHPVQAAYIRAILRNPDITNKQIEAEVRKVGAATKFDPIRGACARQFCGITMEGGGATGKKRIDEEKFLAAAIELNVHDFNLPGPKKPDPDTTPEPEVKNRPVINLTPPANAEPPVKAPPLFDVRTLVTMLRARMKEENYTELHLTPEGTTFKRVQVMEGKLDN